MSLKSFTVSQKIHAINQMSQYLAAYDVGDDRQRTKIASVLQRYGDRLQRSVFLVELQPDEIPEFQFAIGKHLSIDDLFHVIPIDNAPGRVHLRWQCDPNEFATVIVV